MIIGVDFDGTIVEHRFPAIGERVPGAIETLKKLVARGDRLILWTMRDGSYLDDAVLYCEENGVELWGVNENPEQDWSGSPKAYCHVYIDDAALGCPLNYSKAVEVGRPAVDWGAVDALLFKD